MSEAQRALDALQDAIKGLPTRARLPTVPPSRKAVEALGAAEAAPAEPGPAVLEAVRRRLAAASRSGFAEVARRDLRDAPWVLWNGRDPGIGMSGLLDAICNLARSSSRTLRNLIDAWLRDFAPDAPSISVAAERIRALLAASQDARFDQWKAADRSINLFDAKRGPKELASLLLKSGRPPSDLLAQLGFGDPFRAGSGYLKFVQNELLAMTVQSMRAGDTAALARVLAFLAPGGELRFKERKASIARGLLAPWLSPGRTPSDEIRDAVRDFLLHHVGDPRTRPGDWAGAGKEAELLMRQWLARVSLKAFFDLVDEHARDDHWKYRRAFWTACLEAGAIADAWLALGSRVHASARAIRDLNGAYGRMENASEQSVLLFRIGPLVCCEWSHDGKLRAWPVEWQNAPKLGRALYTRKQITTKGLPFPPNPKTGKGGASDGMGLSHIGSERGFWQSSAAELLARRANVHLRPIDWRPR